MKSVNICCNILWFIFGGFEICLMWCISGVILCCTICGIPAGIQCFKIGCFALCPFGKEIQPKPEGRSCCECFLNCLWIIFWGLWLCIMEGIFGIMCCITICGIPFGIQHFKLAKICLMPFGSVIVDMDETQVVPGAPVQQPPIVVVEQTYTPPPPPPPAY